MGLIEHNVEIFREGYDEGHGQRAWRFLQHLQTAERHSAGWVPSCGGAGMCWPTQSGSVRRGWPFRPIVCSCVVVIQVSVSYTLTDVYKHTHINMKIYFRGGICAHLCRPVTW